MRRIQLTQHQAERAENGEGGQSLLTGEGTSDGARVTSHLALRQGRGAESAVAERALHPDQTERSARGPRTLLLALNGAV